MEVYRAEKEDYYEKDLYVLECLDRDTFNKRKIGSSEILLMTDRQENNLHRFPVRGKVVTSNKSSQFKKGDELICRYHTFNNPNNGQDKATILKEGEKLYTVKNRSIICAVTEDGLEPREGVLICEPLNGNLVSTSLHLSGDMQGRRRDLVKVIQCFEGSKAKVGDYLLLSMGGDYEFYYKDKLYLAVDEYYEDYYAIVDSPDWYDNTKVRKSIDLRKKI